MKILKWLKRESDDSTVLSNPLKATATTTSQTGGKKVKLNRNESYLKALSKFAKWRQMHLSATNSRELEGAIVNRRQISRKHTKGNLNGGYRFRASTSTLNEGNMDKDCFPSSQAVYEEIPLDSRKSYCKSASLSAMDELPEEHIQSSNEVVYKMRYCNSVIAGLNALECTVQEYSNNMNDSPRPLPNNEPEYAIPYEFGDEETTAECSSGARLMVTDLDKSQDSIAIDDVSEENSLKQNVFEAREKEHNFELLKCSLKNIKTSNVKKCSNIMNGQMQNGEIDAIDISFLQMKHNFSNGLKNNYNILRKLRHPNILLLMGTTVNDDNHHINGLIFESVNFTLYEHIHNLAHRIPIEACQKHALELTNAALYLHRCGVLHTNICSQNILLCGNDGHNSIKLAGFEFYTTLDNNGSADTVLCERKMNSHHFYQAPELFDESQPLLVQTDVYGICITLWEMLNCIIPYAQFSRQELGKVFTLKNTQLPIYEKDRYVPFMYVLENGLQIETTKRFANVILLKQAISAVDLSKNYDHFNSLPLPPVDRGEEFTSTMKKRKTSQEKISSVANENMQNYELTPNKRYSVNIIINSKCSPSCQSAEKNFKKPVPTLNLGETQFEECDSFGLSLNNSLPINFTTNYNHINKNYTNNIGLENIQPRMSLDPYKLKSRNSRKRLNRRNYFKSSESVISPDTEDFFIDDDFSNELKLETNLCLNTTDSTNNMAYFN